MASLGSGIGSAQNIFLQKMCFAQAGVRKGEALQVLLDNGCQNFFRGWLDYFGVGNDCRGTNEPESRFAQPPKYMYVPDKQGNMTGQFHLFQWRMPDGWIVSQAFRYMRLWANRHQTDKNTQLLFLLGKKPSTDAIGIAWSHLERQICRLHPITFIGSSSSSHSPRRLALVGPVLCILIMTLKQWDLHETTMLKLPTRFGSVRNENLCGPCCQMAHLF